MRKWARSPSTVEMARAIVKTIGLFLTPISIASGGSTSSLTKGLAHRARYRNRGPSTRTKRMQIATAAGIEEAIGRKHSSKRASKEFYASAESVVIQVLKHPKSNKSKYPDLVA